MCCQVVLYMCRVLHVLRVFQIACVASAAIPSISVVITSVANSTLVRTYTSQGTVLDQSRASELGRGWPVDGEPASSNYAEI